MGRLKTRQQGTRGQGSWRSEMYKDSLCKRETMRLGLLNVNGYTAESEHDILAAISSKNIDIFSVVETKLNNADTKKIKCDGFEVVEVRREKEDKQGGGLACLMRKSSNVGFQKLFLTIDEPELQYVSKERLWISYESRTGKTAVCTTYLGFNHPDNRHAAWNQGILEVLSKEIRHLRGKGYRVMIQGDMNAWVGSDLLRGGIPGNHPPQPNANGIKFLNFLSANNLTHVNGAVRRPGDWDSRFCEGLWTRHSYDYKSSTVLDYVIISNEHLGTVQRMVVDQEGNLGGNSDHCMVLCTVADKFMTITKSSPKFKPGWDIDENTDMSGFKQIVSRELDKLKGKEIGPGVDKLSDGLASALLKGLNEGVGRRKSHANKRKVYPRHIVDLLKERKKLESKFKAQKCKFAASRSQSPPESLLIAKEYLDSKSEELDKAISKFYRQKRAPLLNLMKNKTRSGRKRFWKFVSGKRKSQDDIPSLQNKDTGILSYTPEGISSEIRTYLKTIFSGHDEDPTLHDNSSTPGANTAAPTPAAPESPQSLFYFVPQDPPSQAGSNTPAPTPPGDISAAPLPPAPDRPQSLFYSVPQDPLGQGGSPEHAHLSNSQADEGRHPRDDHDYGIKTDARLPSGGQGDDPAINPTGFLERSFTVAEVKEVIKSLKDSKAAGHDDIINEALKEAPEEFFSMLTTLFNRVKDQSKVPQSWKRGRVVLVHKKGSKSEASNYRPITVLTSMNSTYGKLMNARLTKVVECHQLLGEIQSGFRKSRSGSDSAFVLNTALWKMASKRKKVHVSFLDLQKAYDSISRPVLWSKMRKLGFGGKFLDSIISMYQGDYVTNRSNGVTTDPVFLGRGLRQGCSLSPILFAIYVVDMSRDLAASNIGVLLHKICVSAIFFADDIVLISKTPEGLRQLHNIVQRHCSLLQMRLSISKSKVMSNCHDIWEIFDDDELLGCLEKVLEFRYLGVQTSLLPSRAAKSMRHRAVSISNQYKGACMSIAKDGPDIVDLATCLWHNIALPSLLYGCESTPFTAQSIDEISRHQSSIGKFALGLPTCSPNVSSEVLLGLKPFKQHLYAAQLKFYVRLSNQSDSRWSKDALLDHVLGGWDSPYIKFLGEIKREIGMLKWPSSARQVDIILDHHFLSATNREIDRLDLPALSPVAKRARMEHVNESHESQVYYSLQIYYSNIPFPHLYV